MVLQVSGGTVSDLLAALRSVGGCKAVRVLEEALCDHPESSGERTARRHTAGAAVAAATGHSAVFVSADGSRGAPVQDLKVDVRIDSCVCDSGVELSTA